MVYMSHDIKSFSHIGQYAYVQDFAKEVKVLPEVLIVGDVIAYNFPSSGDTYMLVVRNSLCVLTMYINLIPPFVLRKEGFIFNDTPKIL